jgi:hypothetical protein
VRACHVHVCVSAAQSQSTYLCVLVHQREHHEHGQQEQHHSLRQRHVDLPAEPRLATLGLPL